MNLEEFIFCSNQATTIEELFEEYRKVMGEMGFDRLVLTLVTDHPSLKVEAQDGIATNFSQEWGAHYIEQKYGDIDPVKSLALSTNNAFSWDQIKHVMPLTKTQTHLLRESAEAEMHCGIGVPLRGAGGAVAVLGIASSDKAGEINPLLLDKVNLLGYQFYTCFCRLMEKEQANDLVLLTDKEREVLKWLARGFTKHEIADKIHLSSHTVDFHVRNSLKKLGARNTTAAVVMALGKGLIQI